MRIITRKAILRFADEHPDAATALDKWYAVTESSRWRSIADVRRVFPHADAVKVASGRIVTVFNVGGNKYRLIAAIHYNRQRLYVLRMLTHAEYDNGKWKDQL